MEVGREEGGGGEKGEIESEGWGLDWGVGGGEEEEGGAQEVEPMDTGEVVEESKKEEVVEPTIEV